MHVLRKRLKRSFLIQTMRNMLVIGKRRMFSCQILPFSLIISMWKICFFLFVVIAHYYCELVIQYNTQRYFICYIYYILAYVHLRILILYICTLVFQKNGFIILKRTISSCVFYCRYVEYKIIISSYNIVRKHEILFGHPAHVGKYYVINKA